MPDNLPPWDGTWTPEELKSHQEYVNKLAREDGRRIRLAREEQAMRRQAYQDSLPPIGEDITPSNSRKPNILEIIKNYFGGGNTPAGPMIALENREPYNWDLKNKATDPRRYMTLSPVTGEPHGTIPSHASDYRRVYGMVDWPESWGKGFQNQVSRSPNLVYPDWVEDGELKFNQMREAGYLNSIDASPTLTRPAVRYTPTTLAEKASYLASQNERGFQLVGEPYNKYIESRTQLGSAIPYASDYRSGAPREPSRVYTPADFPNEYMNNPKFRGYVNNYVVDGLGKAGKIAGGALLLNHALREGPVDALVTATMGPIGRIAPESEYGSYAYKEMLAARKAEDDRRVLETIAKQRYYEENADSINATRRMYLGR